MTKNRIPLTEEQIEALRQNPYVLSVTPARISLTREFKEIFYSEYINGAAPREILARHGFDVQALGTSRIHGIGVNIRREYDKYGEFHQGYPRSSQQLDPGESKTAARTEAEQIRKLQQEIEHLKQEIEFLIKLASTRNTRK